MIKEILKLFFGRKPNKPTSYGKISDKEIKKIFKSKKNNLTPTRVYCTDKQYDLTTSLEIFDFLKNDNTDFQKYRVGTNDCDDFASQLWGRLNEWGPSFALGYAISLGHVFNFFIDKNKKVWIIEPQTDKIISFDSIKKNKSYYPLQMVLL